MALSAVKEFATVALAGAMALSPFAANAQSVNFETSKCYDGQDAIALKAAIDNDGQKPIFVGDRAFTGGYVNKITMNDNGYGYLTEKPASDKLCLRASFKNIVLNYPDNPSIPPWALIIKSNKSLNVQQVYSQTGDKESRLLFLAQTFVKDMNGNEISQNAITLVATPKLKIGGVLSIDGQGVPSNLLNMANFALHSANFNHFMGRGFGSSVAQAPQNQNTAVRGAVLATTANTPGLN